MKLRNLIAGLALITAGTSFGATGFFGNLYVITTLNAGGTVYNQVTSGTTPGVGAATGHSLSPDGVNPAFGSFGTLDLTDVLSLKGFEYKTFNDNFSNVTHGNLFFRIYPTGSPSGTFAQVQTNSPVSVSGNNKTWSVTTGTTNLLSGLTPGNYTMQIYTESYTNAVNTAGNIFGFTAGNNPTATFTVIPEPTSAVLGLLGTVMLLRRRRI
jgi:hypothetical protein